MRTFGLFYQHTRPVRATQSGLCSHSTINLHVGYIPESTRSLCLGGMKFSSRVLVDQKLLLMPLTTSRLSVVMHRVAKGTYHRVLVFWSLHSVLRVFFRNICKCTIQKTTPHSRPPPVVGACTVQKKPPPPHQRNTKHTFWDASPLLNRAWMVVSCT